MSGQDADFTAYLAARWAPLVRTLVLLGLPQPVAEDACLTGLARCREAWRDLRELEDVDVEVHRAVLDARPRGEVGPVVLPVPEEPTEAERLRELLQRQLSGLTAEVREAIVLDRAAGLDRVQVADVLDVPLGTVDRRVADALAELDPRLRAEDSVHAAAATIDVRPPPYDEVEARVGERRRRRWRVGLTVTTALVVVAGIGVWASTRSAAPPTPPLHVVAERNPVGTAWYAAGRLHLRAVVVDLPDVTDAAAVGESVAYVDQDGTVGIVDGTGERAVVGSAVPGSTVLGSGGDGWVVWLHPEPTGVRIVVWSTITDAVVATRVVSAGTELVAIDQSRVFTQSGPDVQVWLPTERGAGVTRLGGRDLLAVGYDTEVYQHGRRIRVVRSYASLAFGRPGVGAILSGDAFQLLTRRPGSTGPGTAYTPLLYDVGDGEPHPTGIAPDERVLDAAFEAGDGVDYFVVKAADQGAAIGGGPGTLPILRQCSPSRDHLEPVVCHDVAPVPARGGTPFFAD
ncbi:sigma factor-like helix-turn-helix DNA-binding protein [Nocardioides sp.]|uniref:sigma factor-like helix-turn-helix DNA-binding protein n=1 Tax=Nocardioides sp. TaxID=35761 RepID=UPI003783CCBD